MHASFFYLHGFELVMENKPTQFIFGCVPTMDFMHGMSTFVAYLCAVALNHSHA
jgi:hypothetical protein